uniref:G-protein coupled receptors family 1 profile domain-containing protein n=1 Tax=Anopheles stephensi TaxID=30069 RepID=A0A182YH30_ANOST
MISYSYYDQLSQNLRAPGQWAISSNRTVQRLLSQRKPPISPTQPAADKDAEGYINLTFGVDTNLSVAFNVSLNVTVGEVEPGSTGLVDDGTNGTLPFAMRETLWIVIPISVIYSTIFVIGVLGNVITCIVISRNRSMHTATNYYLFSLAISDLLLLITGRYNTVSSVKGVGQDLDIDIYSVWYRFPYPFGNTVCKMASFASESFANATVLTITAFTVERYVAICKPFLSHTMSKLSRAVRFVITIWLIAFGLAIPQALSMQIDTEFRTCTVRQEQTKHVFFISTVLVFVCPMSVITVLYILIWLQLRRSKFVRCGSIRSSSVRLKVLIFIGVAVVIAFFLCWAPFHAQRLMAVYANDHNENANIRTAFEILTYVSGIFYYISTCINPVLYNIMSHKFREAFKNSLNYFSTVRLRLALGNLPKRG